MVQCEPDPITVQEEMVMKCAMMVILVLGMLLTSVAYAIQVDPTGGWDQYWDFSTDASLPASLAAGATVSLTGSPGLAEISGGMYQFGENSVSANSSFAWAGTQFNANANWTFDIKFRLTGPNRDRYNFYGYVRIPTAGRDMAWNFDVGSSYYSPSGLYFRQHDASWSTKINDDYSGWHVIRVTHDANAGYVRLWLDDVDDAFRNNAYGAMVNYGYDGFGMGGGTGAGPKNWEIDYIRFADEYVAGAPIPEPITLSLLAIGVVGVLSRKRR